MTVASRAVVMAVMTEARAVDVEQEGHWDMHTVVASWIMGAVVVSSASTPANVQSAFCSTIWHARLGAVA